MVFFRLHESPRYLVHAGRHREAIESLQMISKFNGSELSLNIEDVQDITHQTESSPVKSSGSGIGRTSPPRPTADVVFDADAVDGSPTRKLASHASREHLRATADEHTPPDYSSTGEPNVTLSEHTFTTPIIPNTPSGEGTAIDAPDSDGDVEEDYIKRGRNSSLRSQRRARPIRARSASSLYEVKSKLYWKLPRFIRNPLFAWVDRVAMVLTPEWLRTTLLVWGAWCSMSLGASTICDRHSVLDVERSVC